MLERAAKAAYEEMIGRAWRELPDEPADSPLRQMDLWENLSEATRENWRSAVAAALKMYGHEPFTLSLKKLEATHVGTIRSDYVPYIYPGLDESFQFTLGPPEWTSGKP